MKTNLLTLTALFAFSLVSLPAQEAPADAAKKTTPKNNNHNGSARDDENLWVK